MPLLIRNGRLIDPSNGLDDSLDLRIENHSIVEIGRGIDSRGSEVLDASGLVVAPGFVDIHVHLREPGKEDAETIETGARAAVRGGFTAIACMPNTTPVHDRLEITEFILQKAESSPVRIFPVGAVTIGQLGKELVDFTKLKRAGCMAVSDDGKPVFDSLLMRRALEQCHSLNMAVIDHCEDPYLFQGGAMNEGPVSRKLGIRGIPAEAEEIMVSRNILLAKLTGAPVHLAHLSTAGSMTLVRRAKSDGIAITAEVTPHHFTLTEDAVTQYGTNAKMNPPLRSSRDVEAVLEAIADGTIDAIASDHAPHHSSTKSLDFHKASFGIIGLETSVSLGLDRLLRTKVIDIHRLIELYSLNPARILGISRGIAMGSEANLTLIDPAKQLPVDASKFASKSRNTPFDGWSLRGSPVATIVAGQIVWQSTL
jgi:dihydroorotase